MKCLERNKQKFFYALFKEKVRSNEGWIVKYHPLIIAKGNISAAKGESKTRQFGEDTAYDRVIIMDNPDFQISETTVLWIDTDPLTNENGETETPYDYIVTTVARSLNYISIAIRKVSAG